MTETTRAPLLTHHKPDFVPHGTGCDADDGRGSDFGRCGNGAVAQVEGRWVCSQHELYWLRQHFDAQRTALQRERERAERLELENQRLADEWSKRYDTPPWRSLERMYRETYPGRDVVHSDVLRWADTFIAARRELIRESNHAAQGYSDSLAIADQRAERAEQDAARLRAEIDEAEADILESCAKAGERSQQRADEKDYSAASRLQAESFGYSYAALRIKRAKEKATLTPPAPTTAQEPDTETGR